MPRPSVPSRASSVLLLALAGCNGGGGGTDSETDASSSTSTGTASSSTATTGVTSTTATTGTDPTTATTGNDSTTDPTGNDPTTAGTVPGTCVHQPGAVPGLAWSLVCGSATMEYVAGVTATPGGVLLGFDFGNAAAVPGEGELDLGGGPHVNHGGSDILVGAFDTAGAHVWSRQWSDANAQFFGRLAGLTGERFVLVGAYRDSLTIDGVDFPAPAMPGDDTDFLAILDGAGEYVSHRLLPTGTPDSFAAIAAVAGGPAGEIAISGRFRETVDFGGGDVVAADLYDGFVAVYEPDGAFRFALALTGAGQEQAGHDVTFAGDGSLAVAGWFEDELDVGDGQPLLGHGPFVLRLSAAGAPTFKRGASGDVTSQYGDAVAMADNGDLILGGTFLGTINLGGADLVNLDPDQIEETNYDVFVARFDAQGTHLWSVRLGDVQNDRALAVGVAADDRVLVAWSGETSGVRVTAIDAQGATDEPFAAAVGGGSSADFAADGSIYIAGSSDGAIDFGAGPVAGAGSSDVWLVRVTP